jgi:hypothetical protein
MTIVVDDMPTHYCGTGVWTTFSADGHMLRHRFDTAQLPPARLPMTIARRRTSEPLTTNRDDRVGKRLRRLLRHIVTDAGEDLM